MTKRQTEYMAFVLIFGTFFFAIAWSFMWDNNLQKEMKLHPLPIATERCCVNP